MFYVRLGKPIERTSSIFHKSINEKKRKEKESINQNELLQCWICSTYFFPSLNNTFYKSGQYNNEKKKEGFETKLPLTFLCNKIFFLERLEQLYYSLPPKGNGWHSYRMQADCKIKESPNWGASRGGGAAAAALLAVVVEQGSSSLE